MSISSQERREREMSISSQERHNSIFSRENGNGHIMDDIQEPTSQNAISSSHCPTFQNLEDQRPYKEVARYRECLKNHAAGIGGNATDGCGEFMPGGEEGTLEALNCSACNCHRNFHRKEIEGHDYAQCPSKCFHYQLNNVGVGPELVGYPTGALRMTVPPHRMIMPCKMGYLSNSQSDHDYEKEEGGGIVKKRFRTKFSQEQKEKMLRFAEKAGWKIQKLEEGVVQQFCQEIGITRRVLKVWMHNNKHNLAKKNTSTAT